MRYTLAIGSSLVVPLTASKLHIMHHAWNLDEVRLEILSNLQPGDCATLSRTSRFFFEFGINHLWEHLTSLRPLVCCLLPKTAAEPRVNNNTVGRLDFYARKVKTVTLEAKEHTGPVRLPAPFHRKKHKKEDKVSLSQTWQEMWKGIAEIRPTTEFLPNLRKMRVNDIVEELLLPFMGISGANLTYLCIKIIHERTNGGVIYNLLDSLHDTSHLEYLFVRDGENGLIPPGFFQKAPLKQLRLDPRLLAESGKSFNLRSEILRLPLLENLTIGLTRDWYNEEISQIGKYLPKLKRLWLDLRKFRQATCAKECININSNNWTCFKPTWIDFRDVTSIDSHDCGRRPPQLFLRCLDEPELELVTIRFIYSITAPRVMEVLLALKTHCQLANLQELTLSSGGLITHCFECGARPRPNISANEMKLILKRLLPLNKLKVLRLSLVPDLLTDFDLGFFRFMANGLPALQSLTLGSAEFTFDSRFWGSAIHERVPLRNVAAFCQLVPTLVDICIGCVDATVLEESPQIMWCCDHIKSFKIGHLVELDAHYKRVMISRDLLRLNLQVYFPNSDLARNGYNFLADEDLYIWL